MGNKDNTQQRHGTIVIWWKQKPRIRYNSYYTFTFSRGVTHDYKTATKHIQSKTNLLTSAQKDVC